MAMVKCPECNHNISDRAATCPSCGLPIHPTSIYDVRTFMVPKTNKKPMLLITLFVVLFFTILAILASIEIVNAESFLAWTVIWSIVVSVLLFFIWMFVILFCRRELPWFGRLFFMSLETLACSIIVLLIVYL